jgi:hypothetical protein
MVDGRNRLLVCRDACVEPRFVGWHEIYTGPQTISQWIWSENSQRRHLDLEQCIAIRVGMEAWDAQQAAKLNQDQTKSLPRNDKGELQKADMPVPTNSSEVAASVLHPAKPARAPKKDQGDVRKKLASATGGSEHKVQQSFNVQKRDPNLLRQVGRGAKKLRDAAKRVKAAAPAKKRPAAKPEAYDLEAAITTAVRAVEKGLETVPEVRREGFKEEVAGTIS